MSISSHKFDVLPSQKHIELLKYNNIRKVILSRQLHPKLHSLFELYIPPDPLFALADIGPYGPSFKAADLIPYVPPSFTPADLGP